MLYSAKCILHNVMVLKGESTLLFTYVETFELRCTIKLKILLLYTVKKSYRFCRRIQKELISDLNRFW